MNKFISGLTASGSAQPEIIMAKNTPKGIRISYSDKSEKFMTYKEAVSVLDSGIYDYDPPSGSWIVGSLLAGCNSCFHTLTDCEAVKVFGWVASVTYFIGLAGGGLIEVHDEKGMPREVALYKKAGVSVAVYPSMLRTLIHDAIEEYAIREHGRKSGGIIAALTVREMIEIKFRAFSLTPYGNEFFNHFLDQLIKRIQETGDDTSTAKPFIH
ncbi:hypothetical protein DPO11_26295 [Salmonella enterica]|nr:hypothetical protein [Salmonella enterica]